MIGVGGLPTKPQRKDGSTAIGIRDIDGSAVQVHDPFDDVKPKSRAGGRAIRPPEALEHLVTMFGGHARAMVSDGYDRPFGAQGDSDGYDCAVRRVPQGVADQIADGVKDWLCLAANDEGLRLC